MPAQPRHAPAHWQHDAHAVTQDPEGQQTSRRLRSGRIRANIANTAVRPHTAHSGSHDFCIQKAVDMDNIFIIVWICFLVLIIGSWIVRKLLLDRIQKNHYAKWVALGEPNVFWNMSMRNEMRVLRYLFLGDPELDSDEQTSRLKNLNKVVYLLMIIALILFFIEAWRS
jgi:hypothetical protein